MPICFIKIDFKNPQNYQQIESNNAQKELYKMSKWDSLFVGNARFTFENQFM